MMTTDATINLGEAFGRAMQAWESGDVAEARRLGRQILETRPDFGGAHYLLGLVAMRQGQTKRAAEHLTKAVAADPTQTVPRLALARALEAQDNLNSAILHYRAILSADSRHAEAHARLADLLGRLGRHAEAESHGRAAIAVDPRHAEALCALGTALQQQGRSAEAAEMLERCLELRPDWAMALHNYGLTLRSLGRFERAVAILSGAAELRRDHGGIRANLAAALRGMGRLDEARLQAERAAKLAPREPAGWLELGLVRKDMDMPEAAAAAFERAVNASPTSADAQFCLGEARLALGDKPKAIKHFRRCLELDPADRHGAALGLAQAGGAEIPERAPDAYVRRLFDDYAETFDSALVDKLGYRAPELMGERLAPLLERRVDVLDAGCGTGLAAPILRPFAQRLDGVDLSAAMVEKARRRGLYDSLAVGELEAHLRDHAGAYDLVAAADVLVYFGALEGVMDAVHAALRPGGLFAFTVERDEECGSYRLGVKNRYAHSPDYITRVAGAAGFRPAVLDAVSTRREAGEDVPGLVVVLRRG